MMPNEHSMADKKKKRLLIVSIWVIHTTHTLTKTVSLHSLLRALGLYLGVIAILCGMQKKYKTFRVFCVHLSNCLKVFAIPCAIIRLTLQWWCYTERGAKISISRLNTKIDENRDIWQTSGQRDLNWFIKWLKRLIHITSFWMLHTSVQTQYTPLCIKENGRRRVSNFTVASKIFEWKKAYKKSKILQNQVLCKPKCSCIFLFKK